MDILFFLIDRNNFVKMLLKQSWTKHLLNLIVLGESASMGVGDVKLDPSLKARNVHS